MPATVIKGKEIAEDLRASLKRRLSDLQAQGIKPGLAVVLVGDDPASASYVAGKEKATLELGMESKTIRLPASTEERQLLELIQSLNRDPSIDGILVQLPLPRQISSDAVIRAIDPSKDVDGFHPISLGKMVLGEDGFVSCTPHGVVKMLEKTGVPLPGANVVIVGRSNLVGKPLAILLMQAPYHCTVTVCHTKTKNLKEHTLRADIVVAAAGKPKMIGVDMIKPGACVIDVGVNRVEDLTKAKGFSLVGDTDYEPISNVASFVTPVPGGVGPMTITMLMYNTVKSACRKHGLPFDL